MARNNKKKEPLGETSSSQEGTMTPYTGGAGLESLGPEDFIIPRLTLVQPTSQIDGVAAGKFYMNLTGEEFDEVHMVFLKASKGRVCFDEDTNERKPICGSSDGIKPSPRYNPPQAPTCRECGRSRWNGNEPSDCNDTFNLLGVIVDGQFPFWWSVKSTAIAPTKRFLSAIALRSRKGKSLFDAQVTMKSQLVTLPGKKYYVPVYSLTWLQDAAEYRALYEQYAREEIEKTFMAEEAAQDNGEDPAGFNWQTDEQAS